MRVVNLTPEELQIIQGDVRAARTLAAERIASTPRNLAGERAGAERDRDLRGALLDRLSVARYVQLGVPEREDE